MIVHSVRPFLVLLILSVSTVSAYNLVPRVGIDVEQHSDVRKDNSETEDLLIEPYFGFKIADQTEFLLFDVNFKLRQERYQDETFPDEEVPEIDAYIGWKIVPNRLLWAFEDSAYRELIDTANTSNPDNYQNVNIFSTGPDLLFSQNAFKAVLKIRYNDVSFSEEEDDSNVIAGSLFLNRELNPYSRLGLVMYHQDTQYDSILNTEYSLSQLYFMYTRDLPYGSFTSRLGANLLSDDSIDRTEPYVLLNIKYDPGSGMVGRINYKMLFSDTSAKLSSPLVTTIESSETGGFTSGAVSTSTANPFQEESLDAQFGFNTGRYSSLIGIYSGNNDYFGQQDDEEKNGVWLNLGIELSSSLRLSLKAARDNSNFLQTNIDDEKDTYSARIEYQMSKGLFVNFGVGRNRKDSSDVTRNYTDDIIFAGIQYRGEERK